MLSWKLPIMIAILGAARGALYIRKRLHRAPQAYRAMIAVAAGYGIVRILIGAWVLHFELPENSHPIVCGRPRHLRTVPMSVVANGSGTDGLAIAKYLAQTRGVHFIDICDVMGIYADTITVAREAGQEREAIRALLHEQLEKKASAQFSGYRPVSRRRRDRQRN